LSSSKGKAFYTAMPSILSGEDVGLRLVNSTDVSMHYNLCKSVLQRREGGGWTTVDLDRECPDVQFRLAPTETAAYELPTPISLSPGTYRVVTTVQIGDDASNTYQTPAFQITRETVSSSGSLAY
jgi:hypothetical protein